MRTSLPTLSKRLKMGKLVGSKRIDFGPRIWEEYASQWIPMEAPCHPWNHHEFGWDPRCPAGVPFRHFGPGMFAPPMLWWIWCSTTFLGVPLWWFPKSWYPQSSSHERPCLSIGTRWWRLGIRHFKEPTYVMYIAYDSSSHKNSILSVF